MKLHIIKTRDSNRPLFFITDSHTYEEEVHSTIRKLDEENRLLNVDIHNINASQLSQLFCLINEDSLGFPNVYRLLADIIEEHAKKLAI